MGETMRLCGKMEEEVFDRSFPNWIVCESYFLDLKTTNRECAINHTYYNSPFRKCCPIRYLWVNFIMAKICPMCTKNVKDVWPFCYAHSTEHIICPKSAKIDTQKQQRCWYRPYFLHLCCISKSRTVTPDFFGEFEFRYICLIYTGWTIKTCLCLRTYKIRNFKSLP